MTRQGAGEFDLLPPLAATAPLQPEPHPTLARLLGAGLGGEGGGKLRVGKLRGRALACTGASSSGTGWRGGGEGWDPSPLEGQVAGEDHRRHQRLDRAQRSRAVTAGCRGCRLGNPARARAWRQAEQCGV